MGVFWKNSIIIVLLACFYGLKAQQFASQQLEHVFRPLKNKCELPAESGVFNAKDVGLPLRVQYDQDGIVSHLGVAVFSENERETIGETLCNFQERYLLDVLLQPNDERAREFLNQHKTVINICGVAVEDQFKRKNLEAAIRFILKEKSRRALVRENYIWEVTWESGAFCLNFRFPSDVQLIMGMDKKEIGLFFEHQLKGFNAGQFEYEPIILDAEKLQQIRNNMYLLPGSTYFIKEMKSDIYLVKDSIKGYTTVFDTKYPEESVADLFISPGRQAENIQMQIHHKVYDSTYVLDENLFHFLSFLRKDFETYVGIEHMSAEKLNFTVIFRNKDYTFHHMLFVETTLDAVFTAKKPLKGTLYTYIPNQNIKNLYKNYLDNME